MSTEQTSTADQWLERYRGENDAQISQFAEKMQAATNVVEVRQAWVETPILDNNGFLSERGHKVLTETATQTLERMGIDLGASDDRVAGLMKSIQAAVPDENGSFRDEDVTIGLHRIVAACDVTEKSGLRLQEAQPLVDTVLGFKDAALAFTDGGQYEVMTYFPRKASRAVLDPNSPFWGFGVTTDDYPGYSRINTTIYMPTAHTTRAEVVRTSEGTARTILERDPVYIPKRIAVQHIHLGDRDPGSRQVDTANGLVSQFIADIKTKR